MSLTVSLPDRLPVAPPVCSQATVPIWGIQLFTCRHCASIALCLRNRKHNAGAGGGVRTGCANQKRDAYQAAAHEHPEMAPQSQVSIAIVGEPGGEGSRHRKYDLEQASVALWRLSIQEKWTLELFILWRLLPSVAIPCLLPGGRHFPEYISV